MILKCLADYSSGKSYSSKWFAGLFNVLEASSDEQAELGIFVGDTISVKGNFKYMYKGGRYRATLEESDTYRGRTQYAAVEIAEAPSTKAAMRRCIERVTYVGVGPDDVDAVWKEFGRKWYQALRCSTKSKSYGRLVTCLGGGVAAREKLCVFLEHFCPGGWSRRVAGVFPSLSARVVGRLAKTLDSIERFGKGTDAAESQFSDWCDNPWLLVEYADWKYVDKSALVDLSKDVDDINRLSGAIVAYVRSALGQSNTALCMDRDFHVGKWYFEYVLPKVPGFSYTGPAPVLVGQDGNSFADYDYRPIRQMLYAALHAALDNDLLCGVRTSEGFCVGLSHVRHLEDALAYRLGTSEVVSGVDEDTVIELLIEYGELCDRELDFSQSEAIVNSVTNTTSVICGRPGYGKSSTIDALCWVWRRLVDPKNPSRVETRILTISGMAGQRIRDEDVRGPSACTESAHPGYFDGEIYTVAYATLHDELLSEASLVIVDETSMCSNLDLGLVAKAIPHECLLVLVGDDRQLAPIGPGRAFADLVDMGDSEVCPFACTTLAVNHRLENAFGADALLSSLDAVRAKDLPLFETCVAEGAPHVEEFVLGCPEATLSVVDRFCERLEVVGGDYSRVRALCPTHAGYLGRLAVCVAIRERLNPESTKCIDFEATCLTSYRCEEHGVALRATGHLHDDVTLRKSNVNQVEICRNVGFSPREWWAAPRSVRPGSPEALCVGFRIGDRVVCEDSIGGVYNGDVGTIVAFTCERGSVFYDGKAVVELDRGGVYQFSLDDMDMHFDLGYAITVHKSQGCEFDDVIVCLESSGYSGFLTNSMLYTAISRTKRRVDVFCTKGILERMVVQPELARSSLLIPRIRHFEDDPGDLSWQDLD